MKAEELDGKSVTKLFKKYLKVIRDGDRKRTKQIIREFVKAVIVYEDHVEVKYNMVFSSHKRAGIYSSENSKAVYGYQMYAVENFP